MAIYNYHSNSCFNKQPKPNACTISLNRVKIFEIVKNNIIYILYMGFWVIIDLLVSWTATLKPYIFSFGAFIDAP